MGPSIQHHPMVVPISMIIHSFNKDITLSVSLIVGSVRHTLPLNTPRVVTLNATHNVQYTVSGIPAWTSFVLFQVQTQYSNVTGLSNFLF